MWTAEFIPEAGRRNVKESRFVERTITGNDTGCGIDDASESANEATSATKNKCNGWTLYPNGCPNVQRTY